MKVLLLAAGRSRRVKPIEDKNFLRFCGKFLIQHQFEALAQAGFKDVIIVGGAHNLERLNNFAKAFEGASVVEQKDLDAGMAGAVLAARPHIKKDEPILIVSTNDIMDPEAYQLLADAAQNQGELQNFDSVILGKIVDEYFPGGYLKVDNENRIEGIVEKPGAGNEPSNLVNLVLHLHKKSDALFGALDAAAAKTDRDDQYEVALDTLIKQGHRMGAIAYNGYWRAIKFPWHVFPVARYFFEKSPQRVVGSPAIHPTATIQEGARIVGEVIVDEGAKIMAGATVVGPAYIGKNCVVATNALVRESFLGERCVIGFSTEVARSVLGDDVWTHSNYIGDSVIGDNVSFGAGCATGNLRFDEKEIDVVIGKGKVNSGMNKLGLITGNNIRVGINTSFMPGIKLGSNSLIGAGTVIAQDIEEGSYARGEVTLKISPNKMEKISSRAHP